MNIHRLYERVTQKRRLTRIRKQLTAQGVRFVRIPESDVRAIWAGEQPFIIVEDTGYQVGGVIRFNVHRDLTGEAVDLPINYYDYTITYKTTRHIEPGYCVLGIRRTCN